MVAESYTLVRAHGVAPDGRKSEETIDVHRVVPEDMEAFVAMKREEGVAIDTKLLLLLGSSILR
jgi:ADP-ribose pyrophosphatase